MTQSLNELMSFGHVIRVHADGDISEPDNIYGPECVIDTEGTEDLDGLDGWEALTGWTGQYGYSGPVMHNSEYVGGALADYIRETPGYYVTAVVDWPDDESSTEQEIYSEGWVILFREAEHEHVWGPLETSRFGAIVHRKCTDPDCRVVNALDDDPEEDPEA